MVNTTYSSDCENAEIAWQNLEGPTKREHETLGELPKKRNVIDDYNIVRHQDEL